MGDSVESPPKVEVNDIHCSHSVHMQSFSSSFFMKLQSETKTKISMLIWTDRGQKQRGCSDRQLLLPTDWPALLPGCFTSAGEITCE